MDIVVILTELRVCLIVSLVFKNKQTNNFSMLFLCSTI